jgi:sugar/nucleoside kinase (ribokinase family)
MPSLLIVGGLTIDRFADGTRVPGGSVLHAGLAAMAEGADLTILTVAGDEPEARTGLARLASYGTVLRQSSRVTTTYRHEESDGRRVLVYEAAASPIQLDDLAGLAPADVVLVAPIAHELPPGSIEGLRDAAAAPLVVVLLQGWLRELRVGEPARPRRLDELPVELWAQFGTADAVVVSVEDFAGEPSDPFAQAAALRAHLGPRPILVLTLAADGYLLDDPGVARVVASIPRHVVEGVPAVGAGDTFGAALAIHLASGDPPAAAAAAATERVIAVLEGRRQG